MAVAGHVHVRPVGAARALPLQGGDVAEAHVAFAVDLRPVGDEYVSLVGQQEGARRALEVVADGGLGGCVLRQAGFVVVDPDVDGVVIYGQVVRHHVLQQQGVAVGLDVQARGVDFQPVFRVGGASAVNRIRVRQLLDHRGRVAGDRDLVRLGVVGGRVVDDQLAARLGGRDGRQRGRVGIERQVIHHAIIAVIGVRPSVLRRIRPQGHLAAGGSRVHLHGPFLYLGAVHAQLGDARQRYDLGIGPVAVNIGGRAAVVHIAEDAFEVVHDGEGADGAGDIQLVGEHIALPAAGVLLQCVVVFNDGLLHFFAVRGVEMGPALQRLRARGLQPHRVHVPLRARVRGILPCPVMARDHRHEYVAVVSIFLCRGKKAGGIVLVVLVLLEEADRDDAGILIIFDGIVLAGIQAAHGHVVSFLWVRLRAVLHGQRVPHGLAVHGRRGQRVHQPDLAVLAIRRGLELHHPGGRVPVVARQVFVQIRGLDAAGVDLVAGKGTLLQRRIGHPVVDLEGHGFGLAAYLRVHHCGIGDGILHLAHQRRAIVGGQRFGECVRELLLCLRVIDPQLRPRLRLRERVSLPVFDGHGDAVAHKEHLMAIIVRGIGQHVRHGLSGQRHRGL